MHAYPYSAHGSFVAHTAFHDVAAANVAERRTSHAAASTSAGKAAAAKARKNKAAAAVTASNTAAAPGNSKLDAFLSKRKGLNSSKAAHTPSQAQLQAQQRQEQQRLLERQLKKQFMSSKASCR
jgi:hypothetical protein